MNNAAHDESGGGEQPGVPFLSRFLATGFFSGYSPWASGTVGSMVAALFFLIPGFALPVVLLPAIVVCFFVGVYTSAQVAAVEGNRLTKSAQMMKERFQPGEHETPDPSIVVIDEIAGMWISMVALPTFASHSVATTVVAFFAFRFFDIVKPYPARQVEKYGSGWGIMLDDVVAGIYANIASRLALYGLYYLFPNFF